LSDISVPCPQTSEDTKVLNKKCRSYDTEVSLSRQWGGLKTGWTARPRGWWSVA